MDCKQEDIFVTYSVIFCYYEKIVAFVNKFSNSNHIKNKIVKIVYSCIVIVMIKIMIIIAIIYIIVIAIFIILSF